MTPERFCLVLSALFLLSPAAYAANVSVCQSGCSYSSIQAAINAASAGDTIIVGNGSYKESVIVNKSVSIMSENGPAKTSVAASDFDPSYVFSINSNYVNLTGFTINGSDYEGVWVFFSSFCRIESNKVSNTLNGIIVQGGSNNTVKNNSLLVTNLGIYLTQSSRGNNLTWNRIPYSVWAVHSDDTSGGAFIYNNFFGWTTRISSVSSVNYWNTSKTPGTNIVGGGFLGGNYWGNYSGTDGNGDGIGDTPYIINGNNADYLPLMVPTTTTSSSTIAATTSTTTTSTLATSSTSTTSSTTTMQTSTTTTTYSTTTTLRNARGDADGNEQVNYADLLILSATYAKSSGGAGFDGRADFNSDGTVNYADLVILAANYGEG